MAVVGALACVAVACSGGDDAADDPVTTTASPTTGAATTTVVESAAATTEPVVVTTEPPPTTRAPATTEPIATDPPATVATETTAPPATTQPDVDALLAEFRASVEADWREGERLFDLALTDPTDQSALNSAYAYMTDAVLSGRQAFVDRLVERGRRLIASETTPSSLTIVEGPDPVDDLTFEATMVYCFLDSSVVLELQDDGSETVINDDVLTERWSALLRFTGERWQIASLELLEQSDGVVPCE